LSGTNGYTMGIGLKDGVRIHGIRPEVVLGVLIVKEVLEHFGSDLVVTSCIDGNHPVSGPNTHYQGLAFDVRSHNVKEEDKQSVTSKLKECLGPDFFVLFENPGQPGEHWHIAYHPQRWS